MRAAEKIGKMFFKSWLARDSRVHTTQDILFWIEKRNRQVNAVIKKMPLEQSQTWYYDQEDGTIHNKKRSFFSISGCEVFENEQKIWEQPVILQQEIGFLGILVKPINGILHFLMQGKIEPGNINKVQVSPTIQATKSNFTQQHGGKKPAYLEFFLDNSDGEIILDQIQSEQSSRFYRKRNRNIIILLDENTDVPELPSHRWMTLGQIKELLKYDNFVNMDTRTVISCIPFCNFFDNNTENNLMKGLFQENSLWRSFSENYSFKEFSDLYHDINDYKMFSQIRSKLVPLACLKDWSEKSGEIVCNKASFKVVFCRIEIEDREVSCWDQPLFEAVGIATFALVMRDYQGVRQFLVKTRPEIGCFDQIEIGPTLQMEAGTDLETLDPIERRVIKEIGLSHGILQDVLLSEEGGRFLNEQNRNVLLFVDNDSDWILEKGYHWVSFNTLSRLIQVNNCVNIQLRNLLTLLEI